MSASRPDRSSRWSVAAFVLALTGATLLLASAWAQGASVKIPPYERVELPNGAVLLLMERHDVPLIAFNAVVRGGAITDPAGQEGLSSLLANLLENCTMTRFLTAAVLAGGLLLGLSGSAEARHFRGGYVYHAPSYYITPVYGYGFGGPAYYGGYGGYGYYGVPNYSSYWPASAYSYTFPTVPTYSYGYYAPFGGSFHCATLDVRRRGTLQSYF